MEHKISPFQMSMLLITFIGISNHVMLIPILLDLVKRDSWISVLLSILPSLIWGMIYWYIYKHLPTSLPSWINVNTNKVITFIFVSIFTVYFYFSANLSIRDTEIWSKASYLMYTPTFVFDLCLVAVCYFTARKGLMSIAITNGILLPLVIIFGLYVMTVNFQFKDYSFLFPVFKNSNLQIVKGAGYTTSGITEIIILLFLKDEIQGQMTKKSMIIIVLFLTELTLGPLTGAIALFGPFEASYLRYPAYEQWRMASIGNMFSQTDFLSIYQWLAGSYIRISLAMYLIYTMWIKKWNHPEFLMLIIAAVFFITSQLKIEDTRFHEGVKFYYLGSSVINGVLTMVLLISVWIVNRRRKKGV